MHVDDLLTEVPEPAAPATIPGPPTAAPRPWLGLAAAGLSLFASAMATVAVLRGGGETADPAALAAVERKLDRLLAEQAHPPVATSQHAAASAADLDRAMLSLRRDLARQDEGAALVPLLRDGQTEIANRLGQLLVKMERLERSGGSALRVTYRDH